MIILCSSKWKILFFLSSFLLVLERSNAQGKPDNYANIQRILVDYYLPKGRNGLVKTSFWVEGRVRIERWEKISKIYVRIDYGAGTANNPNPRFDYNYRFNGVDYGDSRIGRDPFYSIGVSKSSVRFKASVSFSEKMVPVILGQNSEETYISDASPNLDAKDIGVYIKSVEYAEFSGTSTIDRLIGDMLSNLGKKENYRKYIQEADQNMNIKNWIAAKTKYESASKLFPDEIYPKTQLKKIIDLQKKEDDTKQVEIKRENYTKCIREADQFMTQKNWVSAISKYHEASDLQPNEIYPKSQLNKINELKKSEPNKTQQSTSVSSKGGSVIKGTSNSKSINGSNNNYEYIPFDKYQPSGNNLLKQKQTLLEAKALAENTQIVNEAQRRAQEYEDGLLKNLKSDPANEETKWANQLQSFYAAEAVSNARTSIDKNSKLNGNYNSVTELEAEFNQKYNSINADVDNLKTAKNQKLQADYNNIFYDSDAKGQAIGQLAVGIGNIINESVAAREAKKAKEKLEQQRKDEVARIELMKINARTEIRNKLFSQFLEGGLPISSHNIMVDEVYFFGYIFDKSAIAKESPVLYLTNLFPITKYGDGTWPFKSSVISDISKISNAGVITIMGYYTTNDLAEQMRNSFKSLSEKCGFVVKDIIYAGKKASVVENEKTDFWGNPIKLNVKDSVIKVKQTTKTEPKKEIKLDFWGNPIKQ